MKDFKSWSDCALVAGSLGMKVNWLERYFHCPHCGERIDGQFGEMTHCPKCNYNFFKKGK